MAIAATATLDREPAAAQMFVEPLASAQSLGIAEAIAFQCDLVREARILRNCFEMYLDEVQENDPNQVNVLTYLYDDAFSLGRSSPVVNCDAARQTVGRMVAACYGVGYY